MRDASSSSIWKWVSESDYQRALSVKFELNHLRFKRKKQCRNITATVRSAQDGLIFCVENSVMVEIKATTRRDDVHLAQALNYLECYKVQYAVCKTWPSKFGIQARA